MLNSHSQIVMHILIIYTYDAFRSVVIFTRNKLAQFRLLFLFRTFVPWLILNIDQKPINLIEQLLMISKLLLTL